MLVVHIAFLTVLLMASCPNGRALDTQEHPVSVEEQQTICDSVVCRDGTYCRVFRHCRTPQCQPEFACIPCVPEGADDECNKLDFAHAALTGESEKYWELKPLNCDGDKPCPPGTHCVKHPVLPDQGVCCYGNLDAARVEEAKKERVCRNCTPACKHGYLCTRVKDECGDESDVCKAIPKRGNCPAPDKVNAGRFDKSQCDNDRECSFIYKCCPDESGKKICVRPVRN